MSRFFSRLMKSPSLKPRINQETARLRALTSQLNSLVQDHATNSTPQNETARRMAIVAMARNIVNEAIPPERHWQMQVSALDAIVAAQLFQRWGAFDEIPKDGVISCDDLAGKIGADGSLIRECLDNYMTCITNMYRPDRENTRGIAVAPSRRPSRTCPYTKVYDIQKGESLVRFPSHVVSLFPPPLLILKSSSS